MLDCREPFEVYCNFPFEDLGCVFIQEGKVIAYASRQLRPLEANCPVHNIELAIVIFALKLWRYYLYSLTCKIYIDYQNLSFFYQKIFKMHQRQWLEVVKDYDLEIVYHPTKGTSWTMF